MTTIVKILIHDTAKNVNTATVVTNGQTLYGTQLPAEWTLAVEFNVGVRLVQFSLDGKPPVTQEAQPFCVSNKKIPLDPAVGPHTVSIIADGQTVAPIEFAYADAPPAGWALAPNVGTGNLGAVNDVGGDLKSKSILYTTLQAQGGKYTRRWLTQTIGTTYADSYWDVVRNDIALGITPIVEVNFQNSPQRCMAPSASELRTSFGSIPKDIIKAVIWEVGNEIDTSAKVKNWDGKGTMPVDIYWNDTPANYALTLQVIYEFVNPMGGKVLMGSILRGSQFQWFADLLALGCDKWCDAIGVHFYDSVDNCKAWIAKGAGVASSWKKQFVCSEGNYRPANGPGAFEQAKALNQFCRTVNGVFVEFPHIQEAENPADNLDTLAPLLIQKDGSYIESQFYPCYIP